MNKSVENSAPFSSEQLYTTTLGRQAHAEFSSCHSSLKLKILHPVQKC